MPSEDPTRTTLDQQVTGNRGTTQSDVRAHNERLVLSLVRRHNGLSKAEIARATGLSAQTVSVIMRALENDGLLVRGAPIKGRVGQPSVPMHLAKNGAFSLGLKIGRRSADLALMDFVGTIRRQIRATYPYPEPEALLAFTERGTSELLADLSAKRRARVAGLGIATPFELWSWAEQVGAPRARMAAWRDFDLTEELRARLPFPVLSQNDATAACGAELMFGRGTEHPDFVYIFIGFFVGGGIVLDGAVYPGRTGNAGALGPMPMPSSNGRPRQLIDQASIFVLENRLRARGIDPSSLWQEPEGWAAFGAPLDEWIEQAAEHLAYAIVASCSVIDFGAAIIDGGFPAEVRARVVEATAEAMIRLDLQGIRPPEVLEGKVGANARAIGAASLPMFARYLVDPNVLFKAAA